MYSYISVQIERDMYNNNKEKEAINVRVVGYGSSWREEREGQKELLVFLVYFSTLFFFFNL